MATYTHTTGGHTYTFADLKTLMAKATPERSGDQLAGVAADSAAERVAAQRCLADVSLATFLEEPLIPYEADEVTRLICDTHDHLAFAPISSFTVGQFREWLLEYATDSAVLTALAPGVTPEMAAAVSKIMRNQDLIVVGQKCRVVTRFRPRLACRGACRRASNPTIPPTIPVASLRRSLTGCCSAAAMR